MEIATEAELKYDVPADFELPPLTDAAGVTEMAPAETHELDATYFDTADLLLARHRRTLRRRTGGSDAGWHLKTPGDGTSRTEHRLPLGDDADTVPAELVAEVRAIIRSAELRPVARLRTRRVETPLRDGAGRTLALVEQDEVRADTDDGQQTWKELEVELVDGGPKVLKAVEKRLLAAGATHAAGPSKLARALGDRLTASRTSAGDADTDARADGKSRSGPSAAAAVLDYARAQRDAIVANDPGVRHGDPEAVHRMRVATRRLRSTLKTFRPLWSRELTDFLSGELKWLAERLGEVRDGQVLTGRLTAAVDREGTAFEPIGARVREHLGGNVQSGHGALRDALDGTRYLRLLDELDDLVDSGGKEGRNSRETGDRAVLRRARNALAKADALLDAAGSTEGGGTGTEHRDEHLHEARKAYKRARYAVEVFVPTVGKPAKRLVERLTRLQDVLGDHQDSVVAREVLRDVADSARAAGDDTFAYGVLYARQEHAGEAVLADLPIATWESRERKLRAWLD
ncbi:MAG TPA: CYTH and CHAD domain-containing protein [Actinoplanes sp.]